MSMKLMALSESLIQEWDNSWYPYNPRFDDVFRRQFFNYGARPNYERPQTIDEIMAEFRANGRDVDYPDEDEIRTINCVRRKKYRMLRPAGCSFCKNNGEAHNHYREHVMTDENGTIMCPVLRAYQCPMCDPNDQSSAAIYCPVNDNPNLMPIYTILRSMRNLSRVSKM